MIHKSRMSSVSAVTLAFKQQVITDPLIGTLLVLVPPMDNPKVFRQEESRT